LAKLTINVTWLRENKPIIKSNQIFGYYGYTRGMRLGEYSMATNSRHGRDPTLNNLDLFFERLYHQKANANMTVLRDNFESAQNFNSYWMEMASSMTVSPAYYIIGGINKNQGVVIEKNGGDTVREFTWLTEGPNSSGAWFVVQTNSDRDTPDLKHNDERRYQAQLKMDKVGRFTDLDEINNQIMTQLPNFQSADKHATANITQMNAKSLRFDLTSWVQKPRANSAKKSLSMVDN
jgi:hypothetical protein